MDLTEIHDMVVWEDDLSVGKLISSLELNHHRDEVYQRQDRVLVVVDLAVLDACHLVAGIIGNM